MHSASILIADRLLGRRAFKVLTLFLLEFACAIGGRAWADQPAFAITDIAVQPDAVTLKWPTQAGGHYRIERSENLVLWKTLAASHPPGGSTGALASFVDQAAPDSRAYYRVVDLGSARPTHFVLIPGGVFQMGDSFGEGEIHERPVHTVDVSTFLLQATQTTKAEWDEVKAWALENGYTFDDLYPGNGKGSDHPVHSVSWFDVLKWCNARSEMEGLKPCYYTDPEMTRIWRTGDPNPGIDWAAPGVDWSADGYRLPTEAEWEKAARGGLSSRRFPWGDTITHADANYFSSASYDYDTSPTRGFHPLFQEGVFPYTSPVGSFPPNAYGLYDMVGNLYEWCWDCYGESYYASSPLLDPHGPLEGFRIIRGGNTIPVRMAARTGDNPLVGEEYIGFRPARNR